MRLKLKRFSLAQQGDHSCDPVQRKWVIFGKYRPIGPSMSVFKYQDIFYFDTFFDSWGDFECKRQKDKNIGNTLGVFLQKDGESKQVCEYLMTDNKI